MALAPSSASTPAPSPRRIAGLDGLRAIAALLVLSYHVASVYVPHGTLLNKVTMHGWLGVDVFFCISGFILFLPFARAARGGRPVSLRHYASSRARRILPAYYLCLLIIIPMAHMDLLVRWKGWWQVFTNATFTTPWFTGPFGGHAINAVAWTLFCEVVFYVLLPFGAHLFVKRRWTWGLPLVLLAGNGLNWLVIQLLLHGRDTFSLGAHATLNQNLNTFQGTFTEFALGMMVAVVWVALERRGITVPYAVALASIAVGVLVIAAEIAFMDALGDRYTTGASRFGMWPLITHREVLALGAAFLIFGLCYRRTFVTAALDWRPIRYLGVLSYGIYLWHYPISRQVAHSLQHHRSLGDLDFLFGFLLTGVCAVAIAAVSFHFVESRFMGRDALRLRALGGGGAPVAVEPTAPVVTSEETGDSSPDADAVVVAAGAGAADAAASEGRVGAAR